MKKEPAIRGFASELPLEKIREAQRILDAAPRLSSSEWLRSLAKTIRGKTMAKKKKPRKPKY